LYRGPDDGKHAVIGLRQPGDVVGISSALAGGRHYSTATPIGKFRLLKVPVSVFADLCTQDPDLLIRLTTRVSNQLRRLAEQVERIQLMQTTERLASYLLSLIADPQQSAEIRLPCDKGLIATYLGMERESFSRSLKKLRTLGVVSKGRHIRISDPGALTRLCRQSN